MRSYKEKKNCFFLLMESVSLNNICLFIQHSIIIETVHEKSCIRQGVPHGLTLYFRIRIATYPFHLHIAG